MVRQLTLACDWFMHLNMYQFPKQYETEICDEFPNIKIVPVNCPNFAKYEENANIYFGNRINDGDLFYMPHLDWIHFGSIGTDKISDKIAAQKKLTITNSRGTMEEAVASTAISFIFALAKGHNQIRQSILDGSFSRDSYEKFFPFCSDVFNAKFCILGYGPIAQLLIKTLKVFSNHIRIVTRSKRDNEGVFFYDYSEISQAVRNVDFIINLLPKKDSTVNVVSNKVIKNFSKNTFYLNLGRSDTNDETCLLQGLEKGNLAGLALDVKSNNLEISKSLTKNYNIIISPHVAAVSQNYWCKQMNIIRWNLDKYSSGAIKKMKNLVYIEGKCI